VVSFLQVDSLPQVLVAIRVLEIDRTKARSMGLDLRFDSSEFSASTSVLPGGGALGDPRVAANSPGSGTVLPAYGNVVGTFVRDTFGLSAALDLMSERQVARSVAEPNILTLSGEQASVLVGGEVPIPGTISTQVSVQSGFNFQAFGVRLDIRPTLDAQGVVTMEVAPSIVTPSGALGNGLVPGFQIQRVETTARVSAGQSLVLGGLLTSSDSVENRGIPGLQWLPLFRWQRKTTSNTELLFVITPRVIEQSSVDVRLPPLEFHDSPNRLGASGLDADGVPFTFKGTLGTVLGRGGFCLEVRESPNDESATLADCLLPGTEVVVVERQDNWLHIRTQTAQDGWVLRRWLNLATEEP
jgi:pilus assembly protein CpaC